LERRILKRFGEVIKVSVRSFVFFLAASVFFVVPLRSEATMSLPLLEITGILVRIDDSSAPVVIVLDVDGQVGSAPLAGTCIFKDARDNIHSREEFLEAFRDKKVTLTLHEGSGAVLSCRADP
jgi:hypothetical protein